MLEYVVAHLTCAEESVSLWTQTNKLLHRHRIQFDLEESDCLAFHIAIEGMVEGVLTEIIVSHIILHHISIDIFCLDSIGQTIRICEQQSQLVGAWVFYTRDCSESYTWASMTNRARKTPYRCVDSVATVHCILVRQSVMATSTEIRFGNPFA